MATKKKAAKKAMPRKKAAPKKKASAKKSAKKAAPKKKSVKKAAPKKKAVKKAMPKKKAASKKKAAPKKKVAKKVAPKKKAPVKKKAAKKDKAIQTPKITFSPEEMPVSQPPSEQPHHTDPILAFDQQKFNKATSKGDPRQHLQFSSKPKGGIKPSGKKPLWN